MNNRMRISPFRDGFFSFTLGNRMCKRNRTVQSARKFSIIALLIILSMVLVSCGLQGKKPSVIMNMDKEIPAGNVTVSVNITDHEMSGDMGHIIYYMDTSVPTYYAHSAISKAGTYAISNETTHTWTGVSPGEHVFTVQLVYNDNTPLPIPVTESMTVNIKAPEGVPQLIITNPADGAAIAPGNIMIQLKASNFIISGKNMGVVNRKGEGHLLYYLDEAPPADKGIPATTDTSVVSTDLQLLWKNIAQGKHTFSAQLVNNDDTPLEPPVTVNIALELK